MSLRSEVYFWNSSSYSSLIRISSSKVIGRLLLTFFNTCSNILWKWSLVGWIPKHNTIQPNMGFIKSMGRQIFFSTTTKTYITNTIQWHIYTSTFYFIYIIEDCISSTLKHFSNRNILVNWYTKTTVLRFF